MHIRILLPQRAYAPGPPLFRFKKIRALEPNEIPGGDRALCGFPELWLWRRFDISSDCKWPGTCQLLIIRGGAQRPGGQRLGGTHPHPAKTLQAWWRREGQAWEAREDSRSQEVFGNPPVVLSLGLSFLGGHGGGRLNQFQAVEKLCYNYLHKMGVKSQKPVSFLRNLGGESSFTAPRGLRPGTGHPQAVHK